ncbi:MAG: hypothetical protein KatS3mg053_3888 [Candidatus Roseilinea sp.]|nr:MAG: hypothetical protein KatS3mg053_3888 [Candidatus Roseilinea sp.]
MPLFHKPTDARRHRRAPFAVLATSVLILSACAMPPAAPAPTAAVEATTQKAPTPTEAPTTTTRLVYGLPREETYIVAAGFGNNEIWDSYNMWQTTTLNRWSGYEQLAVEALFYNVNGRVIPWLGQKWEYNEDGTEMLLYLTPGVTFNDGKPVTMDDWLFTFKTMQDYSDKGIVFPLSKSIKFEPAGDNVIRFRFFEADENGNITDKKKTNFRFHRLFLASAQAVHPLAKHVWEGQDLLTFKNNPPVETGPYKLRNCNGETKICIWERRDDYWNKDMMPKPEYVVFAQTPVLDLAIQELIAGNFDYMSTGSAVGGLGAVFGMPQVETVMAANDKWTTFRALDICPRQLGFNLAVKPFDDRLFRHAMSLLVDREKAAQVDQPASYVMHVPWPYFGEPETTFYDPEVAKANDMGVYDPEKAAKLLDEGGYKLVDGKRVDKEGKPISFDVYSLDSGSWGAWPRLFAEEAGKLGIEVNVKLVDAGVFFDTVQKGYFGMTHSWVCPDPQDPITAYTVLRTSAQKPVGEAAGWGATSRYSNPEVDELVDKLTLMSVSDPAAKPIFKRLYEILATDKPYTPLFGAVSMAMTYGEFWQPLKDGDPYIAWGSQFNLMLQLASGNTLKPLEE